MKLGTGRTGGREATTGLIEGRFVLSVGKPKSQPPRGWEWTPLSDVAQLESGHTPGRNHPEYWNGPIPWIGIKDATGNHGRIIYDTIQHVTQSGLDNSSSRLLPTNTVCLSRTASVGYVVVMGCPMATSQDFVNWICGPKIESLFLKYALVLEREALLRFAHGTTHQTIYYPEAKAFHVCLPPPNTQKKIVEILGSLDEKIELNRQTSATLEQMAQALFRSWFVDFAPVKAKAAGKRPKNLAPEIARLFPKEFVDSPLGPVPKGWTIGMLGDVAEISRNSVSVDKIKEDTPYIALEHMPKRCIALSEWSFGEGVESNKSGFNKGDILFGKLRPYFHKVGIAPVDGICSTDILVILPRRKEWFGFAASHLSSDAVIEYADRSSTGTKMPRTNWNDLSKFEIVLPPIELASVFSGFFKEAMDNIHNNIFQSRTLSALRDTLLPKLMSGEVEV